MLQSLGFPKLNQLTHFESCSILISEKESRFYKVGLTLLQFMGKVSGSISLDRFPTCHLPMGRKTNRFILLVTLCSATGVILGGTASWAESSQCLKDETPTSECLTQNPVVKTFEGMSVGLVAGAGAAIGAALQLKRED
jgi:hypothetical protein